jgi:UDP-4-amino-4,6-dideoxy-N-acetyl-beta-L-altrosamine transaminase
MIPYGRQEISQDDIDAVVEVLRSDFLTQGPSVPKFEKAVSNYCGTHYAVAVNSATSALHIACLALGVGNGDIIWTTPITFVASANCALYCKADIDFVDIDPTTYNISADCLSEKLAKAKKNNHLPKVVIAVHLCGQPCEMVAIHKLSQQYGFKIIEDASHAIGGRYMGQPIGNCLYSDITVFSFHPVKIITTGEGGMALTKDAQLDKRMRLLRCHGITNNQKDMLPCPNDELWNYQQIDLGFNYRMNDISAALGQSQLQRLDKFVTKRHILARQYNLGLSTLPVVTPWQHKDGYSSYHLYPIRLKLSEINKTHRQIFENLYKAGIGVNLHYIPVYKHPYYQKLGFSDDYCEEAERYFAEAITLPIYPGLTDRLQEKIINTLEDVL